MVPCPPTRVNHIRRHLWRHLNYSRGGERAPLVITHDLHTSSTHRADTPQQDGAYRLNFQIVASSNHRIQNFDCRQIDRRNGISGSQMSISKVVTRFILYISWNPLYALRAFLQFCRSLCRTIRNHRHLMQNQDCTNLFSLLYGHVYVAVCTPISS